jgi:uncharacterized protein (DUF2236 family)
VAGLFTESSMIRRVHRERVMALNGPRALLMQAAHPVAFTGFFMSTGALEDPYARIRRTAEVLNTAVYGEREAAERATARVRRVHSRMRGVLPETVGRFAAGSPWAADDPDLLLWIIATLADSGSLVYERYVAPLTRTERDAYWEDWRLIGSLFGLEDSEMPSRSRVLELYMREMLEGGLLHVSAQARRLGIQIVMRPPVPLAARPLLELANFITIGLLPEPIRRQYGFGWDPARSLTLRVGQEYTRRLVVPALPRRVRYGPVARAAAA